MSYCAFILLLFTAYCTVTYGTAYATIVDDREFPEAPIKIKPVTYGTAYATIVDASEGSSIPGCETTSTCFVPYQTTVGKGETVNWRNPTSTAHTVTSGTLGTPNGVFDSGFMNPGTEYSFTFDNTGDYHYFCMFHPWMKGVITSTDNHKAAKQTTPETQRHCKNPKQFFMQGIVQNTIFEDFEVYCRYAKASQDDAFSYDIQPPKKPQRTMYGITSDDALGTRSLNAMLSVKRTSDSNANNYGSTNNGQLHVASFVPKLHMLSADVYSKDISAASYSGTGGSTTKVTIIYHTQDNDQNALIITPHYVGNLHSKAYTLEQSLNTKRIMLENTGQMSWKHIQYDVRDIYNQSGFGNYDSDVVLWSLYIGGQSYTSSLGIASWSINIDNLFVTDGTSDAIPPASYQLAVGVKPENIFCKKDKTLVFRISDSVPVCIKDSSTEKIYSIGYAIPAHTTDGTALSEKIKLKKQMLASILTDHFSQKPDMSTTSFANDIDAYKHRIAYKISVLNKLASPSGNISLDRGFAMSTGGNFGDESSWNLRESGESFGMIQRGPESATEAEHAGSDISLQYTDYVEFSKTNVHVIGVDEPDFVKNDAKSIYVISNENDIAVLDASHAKGLEILSETSPHNDDAKSILLYQDMLIVLSDVDEKTQITMLDAAVFPPAKKHQFAIDSKLHDVRMIQDTIYIITRSSAPQSPVLYDMIQGTHVIERPAMHYFEHNLMADSLYTVTAMQMQDGNVLKASSDSYVLGQYDVVYVSEDNIYLSYVQPYSQASSALFDDGFFFGYAIDSLKPQQLAYLYSLASEIGMGSDSMVKDEMADVVFAAFDRNDVGDIKAGLTDAGMDFSVFGAMPHTVIHKIGVDETEINYVASASIKGTLLNQFALDQKGDDTLRAVTSFWQDGVLSSNIYVLDDTLKLAGSLEGIAPGETLHSTRFAGDWLYLVTFRQVDPFFVIDVSSEHPMVLGELKIPGYSEYLQNYDEGHVIGIGRDTNRNQWDQTTDAGIKISMFDVTDFENPKETHSIIIGDHSTASVGLVEHKSILLDKNKKIISIPVRFGNELFFYLYTVDDKYMLHEHSKIPHTLDPANPQHVRSFYIKDTLYTVTPAMVKANSLLEHDLTHGSISLGMKK